MPMTSYNVQSCLISESHECTLFIRIQYDMHRYTSLSLKTKTHTVDVCWTLEVAMEAKKMVPLLFCLLSFRLNQMAAAVA